MSLWGGWGVWDWFDDNWIQTQQAVRLFVAAIVLVLGLTAIEVSHIDIERTSLLLRLPLTIVGLLGILSLFFLWIGMWRYWIRLDSSRTWPKRISFALLLLGFWYGACVYCLLIYIPQVNSKRTIP